MECPEYAGYVIPPAPPRPDFDASREKLRKLGDAEGNMTKEEFNKMKQVRRDRTNIREFGVTSLIQTSQNVEKIDISSQWVFIPACSPLFLVQLASPECP